MKLSDIFGSEIFGNLICNLGNFGIFDLNVLTKNKDTLLIMFSIMTNGQRRIFSVQKPTKIKMLEIKNRHLNTRFMA